MSEVFADDLVKASPRDIVAIAKALGPTFAARAAALDEGDLFAAESFRDLKEAGLVEAGMPAKFGGGEASIAELAAMLREIAHHCSSTALAFAMHTHQVAIPAWRWKHQDAAPMVPLLKRIAAERIILVSSGGSDWIAGSGTAERVDGGYRITGRKRFCSASPAGDLFMTGAVLDDPDAGGPFVLHFGIPMKSPHVTIVPTWKSLGMRSTGSHDVVIDGHVVPEEAVGLRRKQGEWHPLFHVIAKIAVPLIYSAYVGVAEGARNIAVDIAKRRPDPHTIQLAGRMETELRAAQYAHARMIDTAERAEPSAEITNEIMIGRVLVARHAIAAVDLAMETAGGAAFYRDNGLERRFRDVQGARYHSMREGPQQEFAGRILLGLDTLTTF